MIISEEVKWKKYNSNLSVGRKKNIEYFWVKIRHQWKNIMSFYEQAEL